MTPLPSSTNDTDRRRRFHGDRSADPQSGYVLPLTALLLTSLLGFTALAVDLGAWYARATAIQRTSDAAALAGVTYLPNVTRANAEARAVATKNGFTDGVDGITVAVQPIGNAKMRVVITDTSAEQFFSGLFTTDVDIQRGGVAEYIKPVPMGSPRNYLGTGNTFSGGSEPPADQFWASAAGYCSRREHGDRVTPFNDSQNNPAFDGCNSNATATSAAMGLNPEYRAGGYYYAIELDDGDDIAGEAWPFNPVVDVYDAGHCQGAGSTASDSGANGTDSAMWGASYGGLSGQRQYNYRLRSNDSPFDPTASTILTTTLVGPNNCQSGLNTAGAWRSMGTITGATEGVYYLQIDPVTPTDRAGENSQEGNNNISIRARNVAWGTADSAWPCTSDGTTVAPNAEFLATCPKVYGLTHLGVYVDSAGSVAQPFLADVGPEHAGKEFSVEIFDAAEGMNSIEVLNPQGALVNFTWEIGCQNGGFVSEGDSCGSEGTPDPAGADSGRGPFVNRTIINTSGTVPWVNKPYNTRNSQDTRFSDNVIRIKFTLPTLIANPTWFGGNTWYRIRYTAPTGTGVGDRTTWSVQIRGDPVRLIE